MSTSPSQIDAQQLALADVPPEWVTVPPELLERLRPNRAGIYTPEQAKFMDRIASARHYLLRNEYGFRCRDCNRVHAYLTVGCVERPWHGLSEVYGIIEEYDPLWENADGTVEAEHRISGYRLGSVVPISARDALRYWLKIRDRGYRQTEKYIREIVLQLQGGFLEVDLSLPGLRQ